MGVDSKRQQPSLDYGSNLVKRLFAAGVLYFPSLSDRPRLNCFGEFVDSSGERRKLWSALSVYVSADAAPRLRFYPPALPRLSGFSLHPLAFFFVSCVPHPLCTYCRNRSLPYLYTVMTS